MYSLTHLMRSSRQALRDKLKPVKAALESLLRHRNAELEEESKYLAMQHKLVDKYGGAHAGAEVEQELAFVDEQVKEAKAEQKEARACNTQCEACSMPRCLKLSDARYVLCARRLRLHMRRSCRPSSARAARQRSWASRPTCCSRTTR